MMRLVEVLAYQLVLREAIIEGSDEPGESTLRVFEAACMPDAADAMRRAIARYHHYQNHGEFYHADHRVKG